jgi:hypothetical protein
MFKLLKSGEIIEANSYASSFLIIVLGQRHYFLIQTHTSNAYYVHKSIVNNSTATITLETLNPGGIRTRVVRYLGGCDVHCATPQRPFWQAVIIPWKRGVRLSAAIKIK